MANTLAWTAKIFDGGWLDGGGGTLDVTAPADGALVATVGAADVADLDRAVAKAARAQQEWAAKPYPERASVMMKAAAILEQNPERLTRWLIPESGSSHGKAGAEVGLVLAELTEAATLASQPYGQVLRSAKSRFSVGRYVPMGVIGVISPFNFPAVLSMRSVAPALAVGNAVVLKPDPRTPISGGLILAEILAEAGLPDGLLHVLPSGADVGAALVSHPDVPCISFTGSTAAGRRIAEAAAPLLKKVHLELGGNNAFLVLPDADIEAAASAGAWGSFLHQGQICMASGRHLVSEHLAEQYTAELAKIAARITVGDPTDPSNALGPIIDENQLKRVDSIVQATVTAGAELAAGGTFNGLYYRPTVLGNVPKDSPAFTEEIFGPVAPITTYRTVDEAIDIVNSSEYGLSVAVLTSNPFKAYELADRIRSGAVHINDQTIDDEAVAPFGGVKASGSGGHFGTTVNLDTFCDLQWVTMQSDIQKYPF
ncbi:aldehyde dehydrogenase family protein [Rhodococcus sp. IEGM 1370]|uniref:aldehyde dehydrogenase family protein n=1 Tax=Rhodococcus sp. IEGM 1370 TaxID=3082222 RepID=UPI002952A8B2|nr:aldehyde dehydrogenase family protein [Rhodococcus sp. IEGM 1370]MDV8079483.1 aldehyde dehydrogenase family protein [Rhodococcus sp. IEGM 1370]